MGPNGSGKTTLLRTIYRVLKPRTGVIRLDGADVWQMTTRQAARHMAVVTQERAGDFDFSVFEIVLMGRMPHQRVFQGDSSHDYHLVTAALARVGLSGFASRSFKSLSGGEKQRVLIARALAQEARVLILDEPTNHLDVYYQLEILDLVRSLSVTTLAAMHDLNLAAHYCDRIILLMRGRIVDCGVPDEVLNPDLIRKVYGVAADVIRHPKTMKPYVIFLPRSSRGHA